MAIARGTDQGTTLTGGPGYENLFSLTCSAPGQRLLIVVMYGYGSAAMTWDVLNYRPKYAGTVMTKLGGVSTSTYGQYTSLEVWYLLDAAMPGSAGANNIATYVATSSYNNSYIAFELTGANQAAPVIATASANGGSVASPVGTTNVTPDGSSGVVFSAASEWGVATLVAASSATQIRQFANATNVPAAISSKTFSSQTAQTMSWTYTGTANQWIHAPFTVNDYVAAATSDPIWFGANF